MPLRAGKWLIFKDLAGFPAENDLWHQEDRVSGAGGPFTFLI
jgi:hypothetical protein